VIPYVLTGGFMEDKFSRVTEIDWARLAAFIDGEGCIRIDVQAPSAGNTFHARHLLEVRVYGCDPRLMLWCKRTFAGGNVKPVRKKNPKPQWKQEYTWYTASKQAERVLLGCLPYFIVKQEHAEVALAFRKLIGSVGKPLPKGNLEKREALRKKLVELNRKGVPIETVQ
jgi:hypothetical protein